MDVGDKGQGDGSGWVRAFGFILHNTRVGWVDLRKYFCIVCLRLFLLQLAEIVFLHSANNLLSRLTAEPPPSLTLCVCVLHLIAVVWSWSQEGIIENIRKINNSYPGEISDSEIKVDATDNGSGYNRCRSCTSSFCNICANEQS